MKCDLRMTRELKSLAKDLQEDFKLSDYEALNLALKIEQNELLRIAFVISSSDKYPTGLESIAIALGYTRK